MPRNADPARRRLREATLNLVEQRGFENTTAAEIAAKAGVTERTFFRHFPDKREALFDGEDAFRADLAQAVVQAPEALAPMDTLLHAFRSVVPVVERNRPFTERRQRMIASTPALQERVMLKTATLTAAIADALVERGADRSSAALASQVGMAAFAEAIRTWFAESRSELDTHLLRAFDLLQRLTRA